MYSQYPLIQVSGIFIAPSGGGNSAYVNLNVNDYLLVTPAANATD